MVRWVKGTFEFDQPYKQTESKKQMLGIFYAIGKIKLVNVWMLRKVDQYKQKKRRWLTRDPPLPIQQMDLPGIH